MSARTWLTLVVDIIPHAILFRLPQMTAEDHVPGDHGIFGEALIALRHEELKKMAFISVGHRLTILKGVYDVKVTQDIVFHHGL